MSDRPIATHISKFYDKIKKTQFYQNYTVAREYQNLIDALVLKM